MKYIILTIAGFILCVLQCYISFLELKSGISSTCMDCSYLGEIIRYSLFAVLLFIYLMVTKKMKVQLRLILFTILYLLISFSTNYSIYFSRLTSWSTFRQSEELIGTLMKSYLPLLVSAVIIWFLALNILKQDPHIKENKLTDGSI
ncbi:hypothetical protein M2347_002511 [Chryseobacterium sp. H1D6B]|uniref:hypothetical protein n=1 Tax=Chryseobacterium sp. H1D6B TaxID=2940588 RepID=UPI001793EAA4|nr:hypothetical protein [Chryseobacterium sp. H1D6B]MDH6252784.1 hypothetical protein [Chryseobacterium sp. H1D6B]